MILKPVKHGIPIILIAGSLFHEGFHFFGKNNIAAIFFPVNESVWEHLKLGISAVLFYALAEYFFSKQKQTNFFCARFFGTLILNATILAIFYSYEAFVGHNIVWLDILSYAIGVVFCQLFVQRFTARLHPSVWISRICALAWPGFLILFGYFTFHPPKLPIFQEKHSGIYGIPG